MKQGTPIRSVSPCLFPYIPTHIQIQPQTQLVYVVLVQTFKHPKLNEHLTEINNTTFKTFT